MSIQASSAPPSKEAHVLEFARAFRSAARAVGFYPPSHQAVTSALDQVAATARAATAGGPLCLTILPHALLAGGVPLDATETVVADLAAMCHRHGIGAVILDGRCSVGAWQAFFMLLARKPDELRNAGGIQRQWKALRHSTLGILEIDFGALLRGKVGGDFDELAGVISHYLETAGIGGSILDDPCGALRRAIDSAPDESQAVNAILRELRAAAQLTWTQPQQLDEVFRRAAAIGEYLSETLMEKLLERRGLPEATVGTLDVVRALLERMPDATVSRFLSNVMSEAGAASTRLTETFRSLVPNADRRRLIVHEAQDVALEADVLQQWTELERSLEAHSDRRFISDQYGHELHTLQDRADHSAPAVHDAPEMLATWLGSISDEAVRDLDLQLLSDLARSEADAVRLRKILDILQSHILESLAAEDWTGAARTLDAMHSVAAASADRTLRVLAAETLQKLGASAASGQALAALAGAEPDRADVLIRALAVLGAPLMPAIAQRWAADRQSPVRERLEQVVTATGKPGREGLRRLLASDSEAAGVRVAAIRLLELTPGAEHFPALEAALSDPRDEVRAEAFRALARSGGDRASDILARGIARADAATQPRLLETLHALGDSRTLPVLQRLFSQLDPQAAPVPVYLAMIAEIERGGDPEAARVLSSVAERTRWRTPVRTWRLRAAAKAALRAVGRRAGAAAGPASGDAARNGGKASR